jgi:hypothetical protein
MSFPAQSDEYMVHPLKSDEAFDPSVASNISFCTAESCVVLPLAISEVFCCSPREVVSWLTFSKTFWLVSDVLVDVLVVMVVLVDVLVVPSLACKDLCGAEIGIVDLLLVSEEITGAEIGIVDLLLVPEAFAMPGRFWPCATSTFDSFSNVSDIFSSTAGAGELLVCL